MAKLLLKAGVGPQSIELDDEVMTLGRRAGNRVVLDDTFTSARHAAIGRRDGRFVVEDLHSSNGTFVNNARITGAQPLQHGDRVRVGRSTYELVEREEPGTPAAPAWRPPATPAPAEAPQEWDMEATQILTAELVPMGNAVQEIKRSAPVEFQLRLPDDPPVERTQTVDLVQMATDNPDLLDALVGSLKSQRDQEQLARDQRRRQIMEQWCKVCAYAERLKTKVTGHPQVKFFQISGRNNDITIRIQRTAEARIELLYFSLAHPNGDLTAPQGIWFRHTGAPDTNLPSAEAASREMVRHMAFVFAAA